MIRRWLVALFDRQLRELIRDEVDLYLAEMEPPDDDDARHELRHHR